MIVNAFLTENEPHWMDVVTEILLSLLTEASNLRRQVVDQVFNIIVPHLTSSSLKIILEVGEKRRLYLWPTYSTPSRCTATIEGLVKKNLIKKKDLFQEKLIIPSANI